VEFDDRRTETKRGIDLAFRRFDEQADSHASVRELGDDGTEGVDLARRVETPLRRALLPLLGHDARRMRTVAKRDLEHLDGCRHLEVQRQFDLGHQPLDIAVGDVAPVLAKMRRDPVRARLRRENRCSHRVRMVAAACVPDGRNVVDIDAETEPVHAAARLPGLIAGIAARSAGTESAS